jgi:hypothetical protein
LNGAGAQPKAIFEPRATPIDARMCVRIALAAHAGSRWLSASTI